MHLMASTALRTKHVALWRDLLAKLAVDSMLHVTRVKSRALSLGHDMTLVRVSEMDITFSFWSAGIVFRGDMKVTPHDMSIDNVSLQSRDWQRLECQTEFCACLIVGDLAFKETAVKSTPVTASILTRVYHDTLETDYWLGVSDIIAKLGITLFLVSGEISPRGRAVLESRNCTAIAHVPRDSLLKIASVTAVKLTTAAFLPRAKPRHVTKVSKLSVYSSSLQSEQLFLIPHSAHASIVLW